MNINFYKKQTVLNDILANKNIIVVDNSQLNTFINKSNKKSGQYLISDIEEITDNNVSNLSILINLYRKYYNLNTSVSNISNKELEDLITNIKRYNNIEKSIKVNESEYYYDFKNNQNNSYTAYNQITQSNSVLLDTTDNLLYYIQYNKMNLMSYLINTTNGFDYKNHMLYFNIDNEYIHSLNNTLYYNFNKIRNTSIDSRGIGLIDPNYFNVKNSKQYNNNYSNVLYLNKEFKYDMFMTLSKLKNFYSNCQNIYDSLSYYANIKNYNKNYLSYITLSTSYVDISYIDINNDNKQFRICYNTIIDNISFSNSKLYYSNSQLGINLLEIDDENTLYIDDIKNIKLNIGDFGQGGQGHYIYSYVDKNNSDLYKNVSSLIVDKNKIDTTVSYNYNYKYLTTYITTNFVETSTNIYENQTIISTKPVIQTNVNKYIIGASYNINIPSNIDRTIFSNSGLSIIYNDSPYIENRKIGRKVNNKPNYSYYSTTYNNINKIVVSYSYHTHIVIPQQHELNIIKINNKISGHYESKLACVNKSFVNHNNSYFILSSKQLFNFPYSSQYMMYITKSINIVTPSRVYTYEIHNSNFKFREYNIKINDYLFNELFSRNLITKNPNLHYFKVYDENNSFKYYPILNSYPTRYLNDKFFNSYIYEYDNYPSIEEIDTCISDIKYLKNNNLNNQLYLYEIYRKDDYYLLSFYGISKIINTSATHITYDDNNILSYNDINDDVYINSELYNNYQVTDNKSLYNYFSYYLNNFITFYD